jgi:hypothetical protein
MAGRVAGLVLLQVCPVETHIEGLLTHPNSISFYCAAAYELITYLHYRLLF